jgi:anti-sigma factor RsiW
VRGKNWPTGFAKQDIAMKNKTCGKIRLLLVEYSDGALSANETRQIATHLAECAACREELYLLEHSLALAREVWNEAATLETATEILPSPSGRGAGGEGEAISVTTPLTLALCQRERGRKVRRPLAWIGGVAVASAVVILLLFGQAIFSPFKPSGITPKPVEIAKSNTTQTTSARPNEDIDVMEYIAREERSARLAASVQLLADQPGLAQYKEDAERYLKEHYADTAAVRMLEKQQTPPD